MENKCSLCGSLKIAEFDKEIDLKICQECGYIFVDPKPSKEEIKKYYSGNDNYDWWQEREKGFDVLSKRRLDIVMKYKSGGKLLDVGAGIGQFLSFAKKHFDLTGTEVSTHAIKIAKDKYSIGLLEGEVEEMDLGFGNYDAITLFHVLEHVHDPGLLLRKCQSLLADKGILIIAVPNDINKFAKRRIKQLLKRLRIGRFQHYGDSGLTKIDLKKQIGEVHLSQFTQHSLRYYFHNNNLKILADSLDPYYIGNSARDRIKYAVFYAINKIVGKNYYDTMLFVISK